MVTVRTLKENKHCLKIAIFSGAIPSSTFIEHLISGVSQKHQVLLFGVVEKKKIYVSRNIKLYKTPYSHWINLCYTLWRLFLLGFKHPRDVIKLFNEVRRFKHFYQQWIWFTKFLPIVLYKPDIFHLQWARDLEFYYFLKDKFNIKLVVSLRGAHINYTPIVESRMATIYKRTFPNVNAFHAVSEAIGLEAQKYGAVPKTIILIHSPVQRSTFDKFNDLKQKRNKPLKILSIGRHHWIKGYNYAISAIQILKERGMTFEYSIIAQGKVPENILFQVNQLGLQKEVIFIAGIEQDVLFEAMQNYDILLLPSLNEGIANVVLEAMALGLPIISTDCGGMAEVVHHKETGWLVPVRDPQAIADAILDVSQTSEQELQRIMQNAHDFVKTHFNAEDSIRQFVELYESVLSE